MMPRSESFSNASVHFLIKKSTFFLTRSFVVCKTHKSSQIGERRRREGRSVLTLSVTTRSSPSVNDLDAISW